MAENENQRENDLTPKNGIKPFEKITENTPKEVAERHIEASRKGGINSVKARNARKSMREVTEDFLNKRMSIDKARQLIGGSVGEMFEGTDVSINELLTARMVQATVEEGNVRAMEYLRDTSGNKPTERKEVTANIMTESDKALLEKVSNRLGNMPKTED